VQAAKDHLGPGSPVAAALPGFRPRAPQIDMAEAVEEALALGRHLVVEAGTGVGKTFAYLVPLLLRIEGGGGAAVVATRTIALQEQLAQRDIPFLLGALGARRVTVALAKGRGNYVCRRRLAMAMHEAPGLFADAGRVEELRRIAAWAEGSEEGSLQDLPFRPSADVWELARAESGNCLHKACPHYAPCAYQRSRRALLGANLIVANHALVFSDLALREGGGRLLPHYETLVLDEAHEVEEGAAENFGVRVGPVGAARLLGRFSGARRRSGLFERVEAKLALYELAEAARAALGEMFESLGRLRGEAPEVRLRAPGAFREPATPPLRSLVAALREQHATIDDPSLALEWKSRTDRLEETLHAISLVHGQLDRDLVYWAEGAGPHTVLRAAPVEVAPILRRALFPRVRTVVLTSATLRVGGSFGHFERRVGLEEPMERALGSPFDFRRQCRLLLYPHLPDPRDEAHEAASIDRMRGLVRESGGGAFLLFTSHRALARAHDALRAELEAAGLRVLMQGSGLRHRDIVEAFRERRDCVLFATDTFWQGVDVRGENLRLVVVARLPFAVPDHPLQQARVERIEEEGGDAFRQLSLPDAVLKLRQGFGRLIRTHEDEGVVAILDPRIATKWYGKVFLDSLPHCTVERRP
jgi:ATP-dependent DNA helicase DinG